MPLAKRARGSYLLEVIAGQEVDTVIALNAERLFSDGLEAWSYEREWRRQGVYIDTLEPSKMPKASLKNRMTARVMEYLNRNSANRDKGDAIQ